MLKEKEKKMGQNRDSMAERTTKERKSFSRKSLAELLANEQAPGGGAFYWHT